MFTLAKTAAQMGADHLSYLSFVTHQLYKLIDAVLLQQIFCTLLLKCQASITKREQRTLAASRFCLPDQPTRILHGVE